MVLQTYIFSLIVASPCFDALYLEGRFEEYQRYVSARQAAAGQTLEPQNRLQRRIVRHADLQTAESRAIELAQQAPHANALVVVLKRPNAAPEEAYDVIYGANGRVEYRADQYTHVVMRAVKGQPEEPSESDLRRAADQRGLHHQAWVTVSDVSDGVEATVYLHSMPLRTTDSDLSPLIAQIENRIGPWVRDTAVEYRLWSPLQDNAVQSLLPPGRTIVLER